MLTPTSSRHNSSRIASWVLFSWFLGLTVTTLTAAETRPADMQQARQWVEASFGSGSVSRLPFSFRYDGKSSSEVLSNWRTQRAVRRLDLERTRSVLEYADPRTGLVVRCVMVVYHDLPAVEWVLFFRNDGDADTPILENVEALDTEIGTSGDDDGCTLHYAEGSHARISDFRPCERTIEPAQQVAFSSFGGRSSDGTLPFFNLAQPPGGGVVMGVGWTGQWKASFSRLTTAGVCLQAGMERTHFKLHPGEEIRTPAVLLLFWSGSNRLTGQNLFRQLLHRHYTPTCGGQPLDPLFAASPHAVVRFEDTTESNMLSGIRNVAGHNLGIDCWWIDAGWYSCDRNWARYVGNPDPDPARFPGGMQPIADAAHQSGMKFLLWFEPERVMPDSWLYQNHPEWLLRPSEDMPSELKYQINDGFHLLDLGNPEAWAWARTKLSGMIGSAGIDCYRHDCNLYPIYYWRNDEAPDRQGIREVKYVTGLYELFDALKQDHPRLLLDNCASGGRRIDFEMLRRAVVLTRSDYLWDAVGQQCHTYGLAQWVPITGIGAASIDRYSCRSGLGSHFVLAADFYSQDPAVWESIGQIRREHQSLKDLFTGDFYPLGAYSTSSDAWMAWQFHRADLDQGVLQVFRRQDSREDNNTYRLEGLDEDASYELTDLDNGQTWNVEGTDLMDHGFRCELHSKPSAAVYTYRKRNR